MTAWWIWVNAALTLTLNVSSPLRSVSCNSATSLSCSQSILTEVCSYSPSAGAVWRAKRLLNSLWMGLDAQASLHSDSEVKLLPRLLLQIAAQWDPVQTYLTVLQTALDRGICCLHLSSFPSNIADNNNTKIRLSSNILLTNQLLLLCYSTTLAVIIGANCYT